MPVDDITVIGPGRLGGALALALSRSGSNISQIVYRSRSGAKELASKLVPPPSVVSVGNIVDVKSSLVLITVPDDEILNTVVAVSNSLANVRAVFHTSGSLSSEILAPFRSRRCSVASLHPLASISNWTEGIERFKNAYFCLEGDSQAVRIGKKLVSQLGGHSFTIASEFKPLYHAAALTAAGHVTALFDIAIEFMVKAGVKRSQARKMLQPLLFSVAQNLANQDTPAALTGTYARADESTMRRHLSALRENANKDETAIYIDLALRSIDLAESTAIDCSKLESMRKTLMVAKRKIEC